MDIRPIIHWIALIAFSYIFAKAGILKVIVHPGMMEGMSILGFDKHRTSIIGWLEVFGVVGIVIGLWFPAVKNLAVLFLIPFGIGALTMHIAHQDGFADYYESFFVCVLSIIILLTDRHFKIIIR